MTRDHRGAFLMSAGHLSRADSLGELADIRWVLSRLLRNQEIIMSALTDLQAADSALKTEVATFLADIATALSASDPAIESVVADINAEVAALQAADPVTGTTTPPSTGTTGAPAPAAG